MPTSFARIDQSMGRCVGPPYGCGESALTPRHQIFLEDRHLELE